MRRIFIYGLPGWPRFTWDELAKCSTDTALRDILFLVEKGILARNAEGGRSTNYELVLPVAT
jgi:hypothetical protein